MVSTELVVQNSTAYARADLTERQRYVGLLSQAGNLLPQHLRSGTEGNPGKTFLLCETGDMLGIHPIAAMTGVHIIDGKPSISANLMSGLVRSAGHKLRVKTTGSPEDGTLTATATLIRKDDPDFEFEVTWTVEDAKRAKLWGQKNWLTYPRAMIKSRVISEITREGASDVLMGGNVYTPEELGAIVDEQGEPIEFTQTDVSRETRPETPIVDDVSQGGTASVQDYIDRAIAAETSDDILAIYQEGRTTGLFTTLINPDEAGEIELGKWIIEIGKALKAGEEEAATAEAETVEAEIVDEGTPAVLADDTDTVDAEVVTEPTADDEAKWEAEEVARHEAEAAAAAKTTKGKR